MRLIATNIGKRKTIVWKNKTVETGMFKYPVSTPIFLGEKNVENDAVVDRNYHGGIDQAVYGYSAKHYGYFKKLHPTLDWNFGMFGENLTFDELDEEKITVGSIYQLGECTLEVTKPRQPCYKLGVRFNTPTILKQFWNSSKSGLYFKVLKTGHVKVNDELTLAKKTAGPTIAEVFATKK